MAVQRNPFTPTFGIVPVHLAGRERALAEMGRAFDNGLGDPSLSTIVVGARGTGKTALLSCIADEAGLRGWVSVTTVATEGMLEDILQRTLAAAAEHLEGKPDRRLTVVEIAQVLGIEWTLSPQGPENWRTRMNAVLDQLGQKGIGLLICVDEVSAQVDEMIQLASNYQLFIGEGRLVSLVMAGLPANTTELVDNKRVSFLRRARHLELGRISDVDVESAFAATVEDGDKAIEPDALQLAVEYISGYPYMMQLLGYYSWEAARNSASIVSSHVEQGMRRASKEFRIGVLESTYREMSKGDRAFAAAMLPDSDGSTLVDVASRMGKGTNYASTYKTRLLRRGVIEEQAGKTFDFALPLLREYLAEKLDGQS